jgi:hypothetical protein
MPKRRRHNETDAVKPEEKQLPLPKRAKHYSEEDAALAKTFEDLANEAKEVRIAAAADLVKRLAPSSSPSNDLLLKILTRLVKGLCSGRKAARFGFFVALTECLRQLYGAEKAHYSELKMGLNDFVDIMTRHTTPEGKPAAQVALNPAKNTRCKLNLDRNDETIYSGESLATKLSFSLLYYS